MDLLNNKEKAAILLISLGKDSAAKVLKHMSEDDIEKVTLEIANYRTVGVDTKTDILREFYQICLAQNYMSEGGMEYAKAVLHEALGAQKSSELLSKMTGYLKAKPFHFMKDVDQNEIANFLNYENNQTAALVLSYLDSRQAAFVLSSLSHERQADIVKRVALMDKISPEIVSDVEDVMKKKFANVVTHSLTETEGIEVVVDILNSVDRGTEKVIFERLEVDDSELAEEVKKRMFIFEDIVSLDNKAIQRFLSDVDNDDLAIALKVSTEEVKRVIFDNLSKRIGDVIKDEIDLMGPVRLSDVEKAQQKIVSVIRKLDETGEIIIRKGEGDEIVE